ncbi:MAG: ABC transporter substrate-binding protein [Thermoplasmata archaeon]|nr:MAG: ABC transporter substrate-binding protein [Thermoplasmata archaeon]
MGKKKGMTRREFLLSTGAATGSALVAASVGPFVHTTMAKGKTLRICSYGGSYQASQRKAFFQPFADKFGVKIVEASGPDIAKIKAQVDNKQYEWDVVDLETRHIARGELENLLEPIDTSVVDLSRIEKKAIRKCAVGNIFWTTSLAYNKKALAGKKAAGNWADFWNVKDFPGPRALQDQAPFNLEFALIADGVPMDKLYPLDVKRAFKKLDQIKDSITVWWKNGAQQIQLLTSAEAVYASAWNGRVNVAQKKGVPLEIVWQGGCLDLDWWCVPKGDPNRDLAMKFIDFAISAKRQGEQMQKYIAYGPTNKDSFKYITSERAKELPSYPENLKKQFQHNADYWGPKLAPLTEKWKTWMIS